MNILYNSPQYYVTEYPGLEGYELVNKVAGTGGFIQGEVAAKFRDAMQQALAEDASAETIDAAIGNFDGLMNNSVAFH